MTDIATAPGRPPRPDARDAGNNPLDAVGPRRDAFRAAGRHTARVRVLRRVVLAGAVLGSAAVIAFAFFNPFRIAIPGVSVDGMGLNGSKVTMQHPKLTGFRSDGRPYDLVASSAVQDAKTPSQLELHDIDAHVTMADQSVVHIVSDSGLYDSSKETMQLKSAIHLTSDKGLDAHMLSAFIAFKTGDVDTREPLTVVNGTGTVTADSMHMTDNGAHIVFEGHVHTTVLPAAAAATTTASLKGTGQ
ncbi:lipopolysaccharide-assembly, LptC-related protein [Lichenibacterium minor]|uniref:Lipopolysaccharide-assembly, LptC-related protein n=1 Tax=Lichenibacterium minor TaxID=2316528 RepID=A0A4Q2UC51_9HYPH|nr:LPS export ABC transporter periplasmic protein LptC [Lichenibacterium minor]RYC32747.1 lipopolysaccharide-assembly, LptC-related protein [Lichenibacterium minor]